MPALNMELSKKICPSVIEITLVGTNADTSPAWVSMMGRAVNEPVLPFTSPLVNCSTYAALTREARSSRRNEDRTRHQDRLHGPADDAATAKFADRPRPVWSGHHK